MSPEEFSGLLRRTPFAPFRVHVTGGTHYDILIPGMAMVGRTILFIGLRRDLTSPYFDEPAWAALRHVTRIEPIVEAAPQA